VDKLREEYAAYSRAQNLKMEKYQAMIDAERAALKTEIENDNGSLDAKTKELGGYEKTLSDVKQMLEGKNIRLSPQEKEKWQERILMLSEKMRPLTEEIQELKLQIRLKKQKIGFLK
jgi:predicted  nucleic acid-binding Zn-ribbon protein